MESNYNRLNETIILRRGSELIDTIDGNSLSVARKALEAVHNKKFYRDLGYTLEFNPLIGNWVNGFPVNANI